MTTTTCSRCGRVADGALDDLIFYDDAGNLDPVRTWTGSQNEAVCPGCQLTTWHPHCTSVRADQGYGERVDVDALARGEQVTFHDSDGVLLTARSFDDVRDMLGWCDYIDQSLSFLSDEIPESLEWQCPECGGTSYEFVQPDYQQSGLRGTSFRTEIDET